MNNQTGWNEKSRQAQLQKKVKEAIIQEYQQEFNRLRKQTGYCKEFDYFFHILSLPLHPFEYKQYINKPLAGINCIQVPLELFDASGFHPFRLCGGSYARQRLSIAHLPTLACPLIKSSMGSVFLPGSLETLCDIIIIPFTCDWTVKLPQLIEEKSGSVHVMELPHLKESERGRERWLEEIHRLKNILINNSGNRLFRKRLRLSISKYIDAWSTLKELIQLKRKKLISGTLSMVLTNAFLLDSAESWTQNVQRILKTNQAGRHHGDIDIFLAGSPIFFPNLKLLRLIEEAGMFIKADELCTSERILTSVPVYKDLSEFGILRALGERSHLSCTCPVYGDNDRRVKNILHTLRVHKIKGVVYHVLKGCHPYDIDSYMFERKIKENGFRFIKIETDYSGEDHMNILMRLEAFRETLKKY